MILSTGEDAAALAVHLCDGLLVRPTVRDASAHHFWKTILDEYKLQLQADEY